MLRSWSEKDKIFLKNKKDYIGEGCIEKDLDNLLQLEGIYKPLIVTDENLIKFGVAKKVFDNIKCNYIVYSGVKPNPSLEIVDEIFNLYTLEQCDCLISIGGGSAHDACKGALIRIAYPDKHIKKFQGLNMMKNKPNTKLICINTTAGTGAETTNVAVITDEKRHYKMTLVDQYIQPDYSFNDPLLMLNLPKTHTAWTGIDAFVHAFESYVSIIRNEQCSKMALKAIELFDENIEIVCNEPQNVSAREKMCECEYKAGLAFNQTSLGWVHSLSHSLSGMFNTPHGLANAILFPYVISAYKNCPNFINRVKEINKVLNLEVDLEVPTNNIKSLIEWYLKKCKKLSIDFKLSNTCKDITAKKINKLAKNAMTDFCGISAPIQFNRKQVKKIYNKAFTM